ncbi:DNA-3-methyladenine glycosylase family protein [Alkaliphilus serpentinus]|uniref:DNA-(apurinic or apyrimidinic site) lyase n=1 Tax=Alkaliphilus serpentinus TaxID=1482731 RepID=A0A833MB19_9FIRM|nr:DNA glycosylase [Alkaliphilus serpentinus]KAB3532099.1 8-oxoguanine DNA glycosylase [Alkaliphilus serpentinus]
MKKLIQHGDSIYLKNQGDFQLEHIFECGQCFRWNKEADGSYTGVVQGRILNMTQKKQDIYFKGSTEDDFVGIWHNYFDLNTDYSIIKNQLSDNDEVMRAATAFGSGIRILRQDPWETIISFIISANNNIPRIKKSIELLCKSYGKRIGSFNGVEYYSFPEPHVLKDLDNGALSACNMGYRGPFIIKTAQRVYEEPELLNSLYKEDTVNCKKRLLELMGVGPKVANCIAFFSFGKLDAFPVDVWIKRLMEHFYFHKDMKEKDIEAFAKNQYGEYAGYAQQYFFYYGREKNIGKEDKDVRHNC